MIDIVNDAIIYFVIPMAICFLAYPRIKVTAKKYSCIVNKIFLFLPVLLIAASFIIGYKVLIYWLSYCFAFIVWFAEMQPQLHKKSVTDAVRDFWQK